MGIYITRQCVSKEVDARHFNSVKCSNKASAYTSPSPTQKQHISMKQHDRHIAWLLACSYYQWAKLSTKVVELSHNVYNAINRVQSQKAFAKVIIIIIFFFYFLSVTQTSVIDHSHHLYTIRQHYCSFFFLLLLFNKYTVLF